MISAAANAAIRSTSWRAADAAVWVASRSRIGEGRERTHRTGRTTPECWSSDRAVKPVWACFYCPKAEIHSQLYSTSPGKHKVVEETRHNVTRMYVPHSMLAPFASTATSSLSQRAGKGATGDRGMALRVGAGRRSGGERPDDARHAAGWTHTACEGGTDAVHHRGRRATRLHRTRPGAARRLPVPAASRHRLPGARRRHRRLGACPRARLRIRPGRTAPTSRRCRHFLWSFIASYGRQSAPAVVHDHRSEVAALIGDGGDPARRPRAAPGGRPRLPGGSPRAAGAAAARLAHVGLGVGGALPAACPPARPAAPRAGSAVARGHRDGHRAGDHGGPDRGSCCSSLPSRVVPLGSRTGS